MSGLLCAGDVYFDRQNADGSYAGLIYLADAKKFAINEPSDVKNRESRGKTTYGQVLDSVSIKKPSELTVTFDEISPATLAIALLGSSGSLSQSATTVTDEAVTAKLDAFVQLGNQAVSTLVLKNSAGTTTYVLGTDYELNASLGLLKALSTGTIAEAAALKASYSAAAITGAAVQGGTTPAVKGRFVLDGTNLATGKAVIVRVDLARVAPTKEIDFASADFVSADLKGNLLLLPGKTAPYTVELRTSA